MAVESDVGAPMIYGTLSALSYAIGTISDCRGGIRQARSAVVRSGSIISPAFYRVTSSTYLLLSCSVDNSIFGLFKGETTFTLQRRDTGQV